LDPKNREVIGWGGGGPIYADDLSKRRRDSMVRLSLEDIADAQGDVDAYIAQLSDEARNGTRGGCRDRPTSPRLAACTQFRRSRMRLLFVLFSPND